jgi:hypothetical protein
MRRRCDHCRKSRLIKKTQLDSRIRSHEYESFLDPVVRRKRLQVPGIEELVAGVAFGGWFSPTWQQGS